MRWKDEPVRLALRPVGAFALARPASARRRTAWSCWPARRARPRGATSPRNASSAAACWSAKPFARDDDPETVALVHVRAAVAAVEDTGDAISLRMEAQVWDAARAALREGERVVGWFHSHPGIGAFFSGTDRRTQAAFFTQPWHLGWVIDPVRGEEAWFAGAEAHDVVQSRVFTLEGTP